MAGDKKNGGKRYGMEIYLHGPGIAEMKEGLQIAEEEIEKMVAKVGCVPGTMRTAVRGDLYDITIGWSFEAENEVEEDENADD